MREQAGPARPADGQMPTSFDRPNLDKSQYSAPSQNFKNPPR